LIHKLHLKEQEEKEIPSTNVLYLCSEWVVEGTCPEEDVEIGATASPAVRALGATSDVIDVAAIGKVISEEIKVVGEREEDKVFSTE
jgi:hypothetical protein